jgi:predicted double-glycine peptidase
VRPTSRSLLLLAAAGSALLASVDALPRSIEPVHRRPDAMPVRSVLELRNEKLIRQQWDLTCGAAAVATLLTYQFDDPVTERGAALGMLRAGDVRLVRARLGFSLLDLKRFAAARGFLAAGYGNLTLAELLAMAPAIVPIRVHKFGHFVVLRGSRGDRLLVADPAFGNRTMTVEAFGRAWTSGVGFVIRRPGEPDPPNRMGAPAELFLVPSGSVLRAADATLRRGGSP